jgi:hypothetical protein
MRFILEVGGQRTMRAARFLAISQVLIIGLGTAQETETYTRTYVAHYLETFPGPQVYKDIHSGTTLYVETDGRHVAAISGDGKLLWTKDPCKDAHIPSYRTEKPQIFYIGSVSKSIPDARPYAGRERYKFVAITFNNSQFGLLTISTGEFKFVGQD